VAKFGLSLVVCATVLLVCGCPPEHGRTVKVSKSDPVVPANVDWSDQEQEGRIGRELSLLAGTPMVDNPPDAISFGRDCEFLWVHGLERGSGEFYVGRFDVTDGAITPVQPRVLNRDLILSYIAAAPDSKEALVLSQRQATAKQVRDVIYRVGEEFGEALGWRSGVPYEAIGNLPQDAPQETFFLLKPQYSWDGTQILVPFNGIGVAVIERRNGAGTYVLYPDFPGGFSGSAFGPLPDEGGKHRMWASFWRTGVEEDVCHLFVLDLDAGTWES
jgi:hypothetical protein